MTKFYALMIVACVAFVGCTKKADETTTTTDATATAPATTDAAATAGGSSDPAAKYNECMTAATTDEAKKNCEALKPAQ